MDVCDENSKSIKQMLVFKIVSTLSIFVSENGQKRTKRCPLKKLYEAWYMCVFVHLCMCGCVLGPYLVSDQSLNLAVRGFVGHDFALASTFDRTITNRIWLCLIHFPIEHLFWIVWHTCCCYFIPFNLNSLNQWKPCMKSLFGLCSRFTVLRN